MDANPDPAIDLLYAAPPDEFVERRNALARSLRADGQREAATEVEGLRRPTVAAWTLNRLAREEKMRLRGLFTAGERLRAAHAALLAGGPPEALQEARDDERGAIDELARAARALLEQTGHSASEATLDRVRETLHAAVVDEGLAKRLREGRVDREQQATGFGLEGLRAPAPQRARAKRGDKAAAKSDATKKKRAAEEAAQQRAQEVARERRRRAAELFREARRAVKQAEREVASRARELQRAEQELARRQAALEAAERARANPDPVDG